MALGTGSTASLVGCSTASQGDEPTTSPIGGQKESHRTSELSTTTVRSGETETELEPSSRDLWRDIEAPWTDRVPTGIPAFVDDPNWRIGGHDAGRTFHNPHADGPDSNPTVRWTLDSGGNYWDHHRYHYPLIVDGTVYTGTVREDDTGGLVAVDADTGESETIIETEEYLWKPSIIDGTVYAVLDGSVGAFDLSDGTQLWQTDPLFEWPSPPLCVDGVVVTGRGGEAFGFDSTTGEQRWNVGQSDWQSSNGRPIIVDQTVLQAGMQSLVDLHTGEQRTSLPGEIYYPRVSSGELCLLATGDSTRGLISLDWETLDLQWMKPYTGDRLTLGSSGGMVDESVLTVQTRNRRQNRVVSRNQNTGVTQWKTDRMQPAPAFIATDTTTAYLVSPMFPVIAVDIENGDILWQFSPEDETILGCGVALADDLLVVSDGAGKLWALE